MPKAIGPKNKPIALGPLEMSHMRLRAPLPAATPLLLRLRRRAYYTSLFNTGAPWWWQWDHIGHHG